MMTKKQIEAIGADGFLREMSQQVGAHVDEFTGVEVEALLDIVHAQAGVLKAQQDILDAGHFDRLVDEHAQLTAWFSRATKAYAPGGDGVVKVGYCTWCDERWPELEGCTIADAHARTRRHAEVCPNNDLRIERDALRVQLAAIRAALNPQGKDTST